jgi:pimeloyl-ACP methyl ester carboxylesterase
MLRGALRTARYARSWKTEADVLTEEARFDRAGESVDATLVYPRSSRAPLAGWIALGGVSCMGRHHPQLARFARALAASGALVVVPEVPEWRALKMAPRAVAPTLRGCIDLLRTRPEVESDRFGLIGFSFGAPQVAIAASDRDLLRHVSGIALFGGYCSLERTMRCLLTGEHEWDGVDYSVPRPDPFGAWVVGSNHLTDVPGYEDAGDIAGALHELALAASGLRIAAWDARHDPLILRLRDTLPASRRPLFDAFATPSTQALSEPTVRRELAVGLAEACRRVEPLLDPARELAKVGVPTQVIHGRGDRLIPFTESLRLMDGLPESSRRLLTVTSLFNHSADHQPPGILERARENAKMLRAIHGVVSTA